MGLSVIVSVDTCRVKKTHVSTSNAIKFKGNKLPRYLLLNVLYHSVLSDKNPWGYNIDINFEQKIQLHIYCQERYKMMSQ
jgi:hypothetical protein